MKIGTKANRMKIGSTAPDFRLQGVDSRQYSLSSFPAEVLVIVFSCNHCPYVQANEARLLRIQQDYRAKKVQLVAINSNSAATHPQDGFRQMQQRAREKGFNFPYLRDETQDVARAYGAQVTPEVFVFDRNRKLIYHGRIDANTYGEEAAAETHDLRKALDAAVAGKPVPVPETSAVGCSVKWAPGAAA